MDVLIAILVFCIVVAIAFWPARVAARKGHSFLGYFIFSLFWGKKAESNPWHANSLEWSAPSPPPHLNWGEHVPTVYRGAYEYSSPESAEDYLPQNRPPAAAPVPTRTVPSPARA